MDKFKKFAGTRSSEITEITEGLSEVKEHHQNYGYISESATNFTNSFDEMLVSTIKLYQQYYNIEQMGRLDEKTTGQMMVP
ncbi:hypothetical protein Ddye_031162 [Dipteronia dyeriana]|uniref:Peptidoglycan binding-like domain-containing protein n=1 Tax=Dipteronia dyeriana TaxID=168575 RepID=A0AAD9TIZ0_9ROSI|nr:hypothetical protein Ddye_031162 [Dipteronia dyeriana]